MSLLRRLMNRNMTLYSQLDLLAQCGIVPNDGVGPAELLARYSEREYETSPFKLLLSELGADSLEPPGFPLSDSVWHMRAECIAGSGDYVKVARRMAALAGDALPIASVDDEFELRQGIAWLSFTLRGHEFRWPAKIEEGWIDPMINGKKDPFADERFPSTAQGWAWKLMGLLLSALAVSLGAPFWFDTLSKFMNVRTAGKVPSAGQAPSNS